MGCRRRKIRMMVAAVLVFSVAAAALLVVEVRRLQREKKKIDFLQYWPDITLELRTEKTQYLQGEPIRGTAIIRNNGSNNFTLKYKPAKGAFLIEYFRVLEDGSLVKLAGTKEPRIGMVCGNAKDFLSTPRNFTIEPNSIYVGKTWLNKKGYMARYDPFEPGQMTIRAMFKPLVRRYKGAELQSDDLAVKILEPEGVDAKAYEFIVRVGSYMYRGLLPNEGSHSGRSVHEYFLENYVDSIYADYVRYTMARHSRGETGVFERLMTDLIRHGRRDFALLADSYLDLLTYYRSGGELEKMCGLSESMKLETLIIVDPQVSKRLYQLVEYPEKVAGGIGSKGRSGITALHRAAKYDPKGIVEFLINRGADVDAKDDFGETPLHHATAGRRKEIVAVLIAKGAEVDAKDDNGRTPLHLAASWGHKNVVDLLVAEGADVNARDNNGRTPLHSAVAWGDKNSVELLIVAGATVNAGDNEGHTPLNLAARWGRKEIVDLFRQYGEVE